MLVYLFDKAIRMPPIYTGLAATLLVALQVVIPFFVYRYEKQAFARRHTPVSPGSRTKAAEA